MTTLLLTLEATGIKPLGPNQLQRANRFTVKRERERWEERWRISGAWAIEGPLVCRWTLLLGKRGRWWDWGNASGASKLPLDAAVRVGLIPDDSPRVIPVFATEQERGGVWGGRLEFWRWEGKGIPGTRVAPPHSSG